MAGPGRISTVAVFEYEAVRKGNAVIHFEAQSAAAAASQQPEGMQDSESLARRGEDTGASAGPGSRRGSPDSTASGSGAQIQMISLYIRCTGHDSDLGTGNDLDTGKAAPALGDSGMDPEL